MTTGLARYLKDFSPVRPAAALGDIGFADMLDEDAFASTVETPPLDLDVERREAHAAGYEAATAELTVKHEAELAALAEAHRLELAALTEKYTAEAAVALSAGLSRMAASIAHEISEQVAIVLGPVMTDELTRKAVDDLAAMVRAAVIEGAAGTITVRGPSALFEKLEAALGEDIASLRHVEAVDLDLSVEIGGSVIVTRMSAWAASLKKVLE
ncbi:hypothetical protein MRS76_15755 [Rhizobiaceae bacterium n13]|uniref:Uncharacterized protein n=1 Tax=Ferirhizobium litorale TaxID=2927786 RepID=A0AAE3QAQ0_9HYPH|nr:hypothetical protein [Fererhizobium litorale]MDI7863411.1 hypothetical protein [Fererhizobium litorale]MDI7922312.1 hypothetical protein [Fererhizobium litorale]